MTLNKACRAIQNDQAKAKLRISFWVGPLYRLGRIPFLLSGLLYQLKDQFMMLSSLTDYLILFAVGTYVGGFCRSLQLEGQQEDLLLLTEARFQQDLSGENIRTGSSQSP